MDPKTPNQPNPDKRRESSRTADEGKRSGEQRRPEDKARSGDQRSPSERSGQQRMDDDGGQRKQSTPGDGQKRSEHPAGPIPAKPSPGKAPNFGDQEPDDPRVNDPAAEGTTRGRDDRGDKGKRQS